MQRLADLVRTGHNLYVEGTIPVEKAGYFAGKIHGFYQVGQDKLQASRQRKTGAASFRLLMLDVTGEQTVVRWWLLRTNGTVSEAAGREKWRDALDDRIHLTGYELVRLTRPGSKVASFTWRYTRQQHDDLRSVVLLAIRNRRDDDLRQLIHTLWRTPGFAGARAQVKKFADLIRAEWKRSRGSDEMPAIPARLGYVRRIADKGVKLSSLAANQKPSGTYV